MAKAKRVKIKDPIHWRIADAKQAKRGSRPSLGFTIDPNPPSGNPLTFTVTVQGCADTPIVTSSLTDEDEDTVYAPVMKVVVIPPPPQPSFKVTFPTMPAGDYTLTIQVQCDDEFVTQTLDITL